MEDCRSTFQAKCPELYAKALSSKNKIQVKDKLNYRDHLELAVYIMTCDDFTKIKNSLSKKMKRRICDLYKLFFNENFPKLPRKPNEEYPATVQNSSEIAEPTLEVNDFGLDLQDNTSPDSAPLPMESETITPNSTSHSMEIDPPTSLREIPEVHHSNETFESIQPSSLFLETNYRVSSTTNYRDQFFVLTTKLIQGIHILPPPKYLCTLNFHLYIEPVIVPSTVDEESSVQLATTKQSLTELVTAQQGKTTNPRALFCLSGCYQRLLPLYMAMAHGAKALGNLTALVLLIPSSENTAERKRYFVSM